MNAKKYSELRDPSRPPLQDLLPLSFPLSLYVETTNRCNFRCRYCPMSLKGYSQVAGGFRTMTLDEFKRIADDIKANQRLKVLRFYLMGEPLLNPQLPEMIRYSHSLRLAERTELTTNGSLLDEAKSRAILGSGLDYLRVSISAVDPERQKAITQSEITVEEIRHNVETFRRIRDESRRSSPFLYVKMLATGRSDEDRRFLELYRDLADEAVIEQPMNWDGFDQHDLLGAYYQGNQTGEERAFYPYPKEVCPFPFYTLVVNVNGDVTVCCVDWNKATRVGNVFDASLQSIWEGAALRDLRRLHVSHRRRANPSCRDCRFLFTSPDNLDHMPADLAEKLVGPSKEIHE